MCALVREAVLRRAAKTGANARSGAVIAAAVAAALFGRPRKLTNRFRFWTVAESSI